MKRRAKKACVNLVPEVFLEIFLRERESESRRKISRKKKTKKHSLKQLILVMVFITLSVEVVRLFTTG